MPDRLRERAETYLEMAARERCHFHLSERPRFDLGALHARAGDLFGGERIRDLQRTLAGATGTEEKRLRYFLEFLVFGYAERVAATARGQLLTWEAHASLHVGERSIPLRAAEGVLRRTADPDLRRQIHDARLSAIHEQMQGMEGILTRERDAVQELGYGSYVESCEVLSGIDVRGLAREGARFLEQTEPLYRELLAWYLPRLAGVQSAEARDADIYRLESACPFDDFFPDSRVVSRLRALLQEMGLDPQAEGRLRIETRPQLPGSDGAVCCALRVPAEVLLTASDQVGRPAHASLLSALGYALQRAHTAAELPMEFRWLGDESVPLGFGRTFAALLSNPRFVERVYGLPRTRLPEYLRLGTLLDLLRVRRQVGLLQFELAVHEEADPREIADHYLQRLQEVTGLRHDSRVALYAVRTGFRSARDLRAEQFQAVLSGYLRDRFDEDWWRNPRTGPVLLDLLRGGQSYTAAELSVQLVSAPLSFDRVRSRLEEAV